MDKIYFLRFESFFKKKTFLKISKCFKIYVVKKAKKFDKNCRHSGCFLQKGHKIDPKTLVPMLRFGIFTILWPTL